MFCIYRELKDLPMGLRYPGAPRFTFITPLFPTFYPPRLFTAVAHVRWWTSGGCLAPIYTVLPVLSFTTFSLPVRYFQSWVNKW